MLASVIRSQWYKIGLDQFYHVPYDKMVVQDCIPSGYVGQECEIKKAQTA